MREALGSIANEPNGVFLVSVGTWCSAASPVQHAGGPGYNPKRFQFGVPGIVGYVVQCVYSPSKCDSTPVQLSTIWMWCF